MHTFSGVLKKEKEKTSSSLVASEPGGPGGRNLGQERQGSTATAFTGRSRGMGRGRGVNGLERKAKAQVGYIKSWYHNGTTNIQALNYALTGH